MADAYIRVHDPESGSYYKVKIKDQGDGTYALAATGAANSGVDIGDVDVLSIAAGETHIGEVGGKITRISGTFTRPADVNAYIPNDTVSNSTSATTPLALSSVFRVASGSAYLVGLRLETNLKSITPRFRVHFFAVNNPTVAADNVAYKEVYADAANRRGFVDLPAMSTAVDTTNSDMSQAEDFTIRRPMVAAAAATGLWVVLETLDAFTPASGQSFTLVTLWDQN
ncbi:MAG: hypothetical protein FJZ89_14150 [Chloroflexi bacterium]|nr:hypothetical protein [Chloroflexota bacterium]